MGKQADIDFKKAMGGKKDGQLKRFLIKNKKSCIRKHDYYLVNGCNAWSRAKTS